MVREYDKLVRDGIPAIIRENGHRPHCHVEDGEAYARRLREKLTEEVEEYRDSRDVEELADVLEVVHALREHHGVSAAALEEMRAEKAAERGGFTDGIVLERVEE